LKTKILGILACMLLIATALPVAGTLDDIDKYSVKQIILPKIIGFIKGLMFMEL